LTNIRHEDDDHNNNNDDNNNNNDDDNNEGDDDPLDNDFGQGKAKQDIFFGVSFFKTIVARSCVFDDDVRTEQLLFLRT